MIEDARDAGADVEAPAAEFANGQSMESAALAGAAAIQRLVAECNTLRTRVSLQETELARLRSANESVRRRFALLHQRYVDLAKKILGDQREWPAREWRPRRAGDPGSAGAGR
jgi:hypothetical protein